ncbi:MAG: hypothetical protein IID18_07400, partial [Nitrospinae bacterium]|nr:hypothetical protein [Nitrospinota bacterium]
MNRNILLHSLVLLSTMLLFACSDSGVEPPPATAAIVVGDVTVSEGLSAAFAITLTKAADGDVTLNYMTSNGSAISGTDYIGLSLTADTIPMGSTSITVSVATIDNTISDGLSAQNTATPKPLARLPFYWTEGASQKVKPFWSSADKVVLTLFLDPDFYLLPPRDLWSQAARDALTEVIKRQATHLDDLARLRVNPSLYLHRIRDAHGRYDEVIDKYLRTHSAPPYGNYQQRLKLLLKVRKKIHNSTIVGDMRIEWDKVRSGTMSQADFQEQILSGDILVMMELWQVDFEAWYGVSSQRERVAHRGVLYEEGIAGWYVPTYVVDANPGLGAVEDMAQYADALGGTAGPTLAILGELDSLIVADHPHADPKTGAAHACGHHCQIAMMLGAATALTQSGVLESLSGRIAFMAVPAEEYIEIEYRDGLRREGKIEFLGGKPEMVRLGEFDDVNLAMML